MSIFECDEEEIMRGIREDVYEHGMEKGRREGEALGETLGKTISIKNLMESMNWSLEQAMDALKIPESERSKYKEEFISKKD